MNTKLLLIIASFSFTIFSCKKNNTAIPSQQTYCSKMLVEGEIYSYNYDAQNQLTSIVRKLNSGTLVSTFTITKLNADGNVLEASMDYATNSSGNYNIKNTYNAQGKLAKQEMLNPQNAAVKQFYTFEYTATTVTLKEFTAGGALNYYYVFTLSADGKNYIIERDYGANGTLNTSITITDFEMQNSFESLLPKGISLFPTQNNTYKTEIEVLGNTTLNFVNTFNSDGYITKKTGSNASLIDYEYFKK
jgi:competence protein ComGC